MKTVAIIGGGASGMMAAITAAENSQNTVLLFERQQRVGKKLSATGNGRCNITNTSEVAGRYHGENPGFEEYALSKFTPEQSLAFFRDLGLLTVEEYGGRVYPLSDSANSVVDVLRHGCTSRGVEIKSSENVEGLEHKAGAFIIYTDCGRYSADKVVVACGGIAGTKLGGVMSGYELLKSMGHSRTALLSSLAPITTEGDYPKALKGVRVDAELSLLSGGKLIKKSRGELQFTEKGLSGPVTFDISGTAAALSGKSSIRADFFADFSRTEILDMLKNRQRLNPELLSAEAFTGMLRGRLGNMLVKYSGTDRNLTMKELTGEELEKIAEAGKSFTLAVKGQGGFDQAQVTAGGINTREFNPKTLESLIVPGLFACGEVLDVDGDCGGFNLRWAWASGRLAGRLGE